MSLDKKWKGILEKYDIRNRNSDEVSYSIVDWIMELDKKVSFLMNENDQLRSDVNRLQARLDKKQEPLL